MQHGITFWRQACMSAPAACKRLSYCRQERQATITPSTSLPEAVDLLATELTLPWVTALTATLQKGIETARQTHVDQQQHLHVQQSKNTGSTKSWSRYCAELADLGCCRPWGPDLPETDADMQPMTRAERLSLMTAKAHDYTTQYEKVILTWLMQGGQSCVQPQVAMLPDDLLCVECLHWPCCSGCMQYTATT